MEGVQEIEYKFGDHQQFLHEFWLLLTSPVRGSRNYCGHKIILQKTTAKVDVKFTPDGGNPLDFVTVRFSKDTACIFAIQATVDDKPMGWKIYHPSPDFNKSKMTGGHEYYATEPMTGAEELPFHSDSRYSDLMKFMFYALGHSKVYEEKQPTLADVLVRKDDLRQALSNLIKYPRSLYAIAKCLFTVAIFVVEPIRSWNVDLFIQKCMDNENLSFRFGESNLALVQNWSRLCCRLVFDQFLKSEHPKETYLLPEEITTRFKENVATNQVRTMMNTTSVWINFYYEVCSSNIVRRYVSGASNKRKHEEEKEEDEDAEKEEANMVRRPCAWKKGNRVVILDEKMS